MVVGQRLAEFGSNGWSFSGGLVAIIKGASEEDWEKTKENISYCAKKWPLTGGLYSLISKASGETWKTMMPRLSLEKDFLNKNINLFSVIIEQWQHLTDKLGINLLLEKTLGKSSAKSPIGGRVGGIQQFLYFSVRFQQFVNDFYDPNYWQH